VKNLQQYIHFTFVTATAKSITKLAGMTQQPAILNSTGW
jgi:hypothetical protein